jgi:hypothetical protein
MCVVEKCEMNEPGELRCSRSVVLMRSGDVRFRTLEDMPEDDLCIFVSDFSYYTVNTVNFR